jgi:shikimate kinase
VPEILRAEGEAAFRVLETRALAAALARGARTGLVLACGGGIVTHGPSREALRREATVVWLRVGPSVAAARLGAAGLAARPLLGSSAGGAGRAGSEAEGSAALEGLLASRERAYEAAADVVVDSGGRTPEECAEAAAASLRARWDSSES